MSAATAHNTNTAPSDESLRNPGGPAYTLRKHTSDGMREEGVPYNTNDFDDLTTSVGHLYFHPGTRDPDPSVPIPRYAELQAFIAANPEMPIVVDHNRRDGNPCEYPHIVFAQLQVDHNERLVRDAKNVPIIRLFTVAASVSGSRAFDPATHLKNGTQYEGVEIHDWSICNFDREYQASTLSGTWRKIKNELEW